MKRMLEKGLAWLAFAAAGAFILFASIGGVLASDLSANVGSNCCADLEERVAELEATVARKGTRKVSLKIYGQLNEGLTYWNVPGIGSHTQVQSMPTRDAVSRFGFAGEALIAPEIHAGFIAELGVGGFNNALAFPTSNGMDTFGVYERQELVYIKSDSLGKLSIGKQELATFNATAAQEGNTRVAHTMLSLTGPWFGPPAGAALDIFDGGVGSTLKYSTPHLFALKGMNGGSDGMWMEADWGNADNFKAANVANGDLWDVAFHALKQFDQLEASGTVSYRNGMVVDANGTALAGLGFSGLAVQDIKVWTAAGGLKHMPTGAFVNASYGDFDFSTLAPGAKHLTAWEVQAGIETHLLKMGSTTFFGQYGSWNLQGIGLGSNVASYGLGIVQNVSPAAMDLYVTWQRYALDATTKGAFDLTGDPDTIMAGARINF